jgi:hypothetical protein
MAFDFDGDFDPFRRQVVIFHHSGNPSTFKHVSDLETDVIGFVLSRRKFRSMDLFLSQEWQISGSLS